MGPRTEPWGTPQVISLYLQVFCKTKPSILIVYTQDFIQNVTSWFEQINSCEDHFWESFHCDSTRLVINAQHLELFIYYKQPSSTFNGIFFIPCPLLIFFQNLTNWFLIIGCLEGYMTQNLQMDHLVCDALFLKLTH